MAYLSHATMRWLKVMFEHAGLKEQAYSAFIGFRVSTGSIRFL